MDILADLTKDAKRCLLDREDDLRIDNVIFGKSFYTMKDCGQVFSDMNFCLVLFENAYGFSYFHGKIDYSLNDFVNKNALNIIENGRIPIYMRVAIIDAMYCLINKKKFTNKTFFMGGIKQKAKERAKVLLSSIPDEAKVLLLGAATEIIEEAKAKNCSLRVLDLEKQKIGLEFYSTHIENCAEVNLENEIKEVDYIVATGMIFVSETANKIFDLSSENGKNLILYMETGSNFGPQLLKYGADTVLSEFFPYYDFFGETKYLLFRKGDRLL